jgi:VanZ family protein
MPYGSPAAPFFIQSIFRAFWEISMNNLLKHFIIYWVPLLFYCFIIYLQSSHASFANLNKWNMDKILHFSAYAIMGFLFLRAARSFWAKTSLGILAIIAIIASSIFGIGDEFHQLSVPSRRIDLLDIWANVAGSILGVSAYCIYLYKKHR